MKKIIAFLVGISLFVSLILYPLLRPTDTVKVDLEETKFIAHRGLSGLEFENTEAAFIAAGKRSYYGIETDLRRTADGQFIICHDPYIWHGFLKRTDVENSTLEDLKKIPLNSFEKNNGSVFLATLEEYIKICSKYEKVAVLELKSIFTRREIDNIIEIIDSLGYLENVMFISADYASLAYIRTILPNHSMQFVCQEIDEKMIDKLIKNGIDINIKHTYVTRALVDRFHANGLKVNCWTVNEKIRAEQLAKLGVDYITTNILE